MTALTREAVCHAVSEYGLAWTTQDPDRLAALFTADAVYVERPFDRGATFRGRDAIRNYWRRQVGGKQANVTFRHVASELVLDAERRVAVVTWLAEFDNVRRSVRPGDRRDVRKRCGRRWHGGGDRSARTAAIGAG